MPENSASTSVSGSSGAPPAVSPPTFPLPAHPVITFHRTQKRCARRPIHHFPWKDFHFKESGHGYIVGSDWAMATFDDRKDDQFFDSKRLQTIDELTEIRYFLPYDPLNYGSELAELNVVEEVRRLDLHKKEGTVKKMWYGLKYNLIHTGRLVKNFFHRLLVCI